MTYELNASGLEAAKELVRSVNMFGIYCAGGCWATVGPCEKGCGWKNCSVPAKSAEYWTSKRTIEEAQR